MKYIDSVYSFDIYEQGNNSYLIYYRGSLVQPYKGSLGACKNYIFKNLI
jgi:hypothetical protein